MMNALPFIDRLCAILLAPVLLCFPFTVFSQVPGSPGELTRTELGGRNSIAGRIFLPSGQPVNTRIRVNLSAPGVEITTTTDDGGKFVISGLRDGRYTVRVEADGEFEPEFQDVDISTPSRTAGQLFAVTFRLRQKESATAKPGLIDAELASVPKRALQLFRKGLDQAAKDDPKGSVELLLQAVSEYPDFVQAHSELGVQYQKLNELEKADDHLKKALTLKPNAYEPMANRGIVLVRLRRYADAEPVLRSAVKIRELSPIVHFYLGRSLLGQKRPDEAEPEFKAAHAQGGNEMIEARRALATIYLERGENAKALAEIEAYLAVVPTAHDEKHLRETVRQIKEWLKANPQPQ